MYGYYNEIMKVGEIDNEDMKDYAWCQLKASERIPQRISPRVWWNI